MKCTLRLKLDLLSSHVMSWCLFVNSHNSLSIVIGKNWPWMPPGTDAKDVTQLHHATCLELSHTFFFIFFILNWLSVHKQQKYSHHDMLNYLPPNKMPQSKITNEDSDKE